MLRAVFATLLLSSLLVAEEPVPTPVTPPVTTPPVHTQVIITTNMGAITAELFDDQAPETVANFVALAEGEKPFTDPKTGMEAKRPFYDGLIFHRVIKGFMIQGGCPLGQGNSGPGYQFKDEINAVSLGLDKEMAMNGDNLNPQCAYMQPQFVQLVLRPQMDAMGITQQSPLEQREKAFQAVLRTARSLTLKDFYEKLGYKYDDKLPASSKPVRGVLAMANSGPGTNGSQFFINLDDTPHLTGKHTVFGKVIAGMEVVDAIGNVKTGPGDRPEEPVTIVSIRRVTKTPAATKPAPAAPTTPAATESPKSEPAPEPAPK